MNDQEETSSKGAKCIPKGASCLDLKLPDNLICYRCSAFKQRTLGKRNPKRNKKEACEQLWLPKDESKKKLKSKLDKSCYDNVNIFLANEGYVIVKEIPVITPQQSTGTARAHFESLAFCMPSPPLRITNTTMKHRHIDAVLPHPRSLFEEDSTPSDEADNDDCIANRIIGSSIEDNGCFSPLAKKSSNSYSLGSSESSPIIKERQLPFVTDEGHNCSKYFAQHLIIDNDREDENSLASSSNSIADEPDDASGGRDCSKDPSIENEPDDSSSDLARIWTNKKLMNLFCCKDDDDNAQVTLARYVKFLTKACNTTDGYKMIVEEGDPHNLLTSRERADYQMRATILCKAYELSLERPNCFIQCCKDALEACKKMSFFGARLPKHPKTVMAWNRDFCQKECFLLGYRLGRGKPKLPRICEDHNDICLGLKRFMNEHIDLVCAEFFTEIFLEVVFPYLSLQHYLNTLQGNESNNAEELLPFDEFIMASFTNEHEFTDAYDLATSQMGVSVPACRNDYEEGISLVKEAYDISKFCYATATNWMQSMGFTYQRRKKCYYTDTHEREDNRIARKKYTAQYLEDEIRCHRWIQMTEEEANSKYFSTKKIVDKTIGYFYTNNEGVKMVEFHVDDYDEFQERMNIESSYGGNLSVRKPPNVYPMLKIGHDECIYKQFIFSLFAWVGSNGERSLVPKDEGQGVMISAFTSRDFGFGSPTISQEQLNEINANRRGKKYEDEDTAIFVQGCPFKTDLTMDNLGGIVFFEYGKQNEGYWSYERLVCQLSDFVDVLRVIMPGYDIVGYFDWSCGHDWQQEDGLNVNDMAKSYGGTQRRMRDSVMTADCLGPYKPLLKVGDVQHMVYQDEDKGPFYMSLEEQNLRKYDHEFGKELKDLTLPELKNSLRENGVGFVVKKGMKKKDFQELAQRNGVSTVKIITKNGSHRKHLTNQQMKQNIINNDPTGSHNMSSLKQKKRPELIEMCEKAGLPIYQASKEGWHNKPKGLLQICWERGLLDLDTYILSDFTVDGTKDKVTGIVDKKTSLREILSQCEDFKNEISQLTKIGRMMGIEVRNSPRTHAEIAGEAIEYDWASSKNNYRRRPIKEKRGRANFIESVQKSFEAVTLEVARKNARRQRAYIKAYAILDGHMDENNIAGGITPEYLARDDIQKILHGQGEVTLNKIEKMVKVLKNSSEC